MPHLGVVWVWLHGPSPPSSVFCDWLALLHHAVHAHVLPVATPTSCQWSDCPSKVKRSKPSLMAHLQVTMETTPITPVLTTLPPLPSCRHVTAMRMEVVQQPSQMSIRRW